MEKRTFTRHLETLTGLSVQIDERTATEDSFTEYQRLGFDIITAYNNKELNRDEYRALNGVYHLLEQPLRAVLGILKPTPWEIYTANDWRSDGTFKALPGQEITEAIYTEMFNCVPPESLPSGSKHELYERYGVLVSSGFLMGEPQDTNEDGKELFRAFGKTESGSFYYLGLLPKNP